MKTKWHGLVKIREQRVSQAQRSLATARAEEQRCEVACGQVQQRIEELQQALQHDALTAVKQSVSLERVIAEQQHRYVLHQQIGQETLKLQQAREMLAKASRISADKAAEYLLLQRKQENAQHELGREQRVAARRAAEHEEEMVNEQWRANDLSG